MKYFEIDADRQELTSHRTVSMPIACYETTIRQNRSGYIPLHWHDELQFVYLSKGTARFQIDGHIQPVGEGEGLFINSGRLHEARDADDSGCTYICLNVNPRFLLPPELHPVYLHPYLRATNLAHFHLQRSTPWAQAILDAITFTFESISSRRPFFELDVSLSVSAIWQTLIKNAFEPEHAHHEIVRDERMKQMLDYIHEHYEEKIMLDEIAHAGRLSRSECCRYFKRVVRKTPLQYVNDFRIEKSLILLSDPQSSVTDVAYRTGFSSASHFISRFKMVMDTTPFAYKTAIRETIDR